jgi:Ca2+-binding RTX toxin-like protein
MIIVAKAGTPEAATADYVCDGSNDEVEINAALAEAASKPGHDTVLIEAGTYSLSASVKTSFNDDIRIEGRGAGTTILQATANFNDPNAAGLLAVLDSNNFVVTGLTVDATLAPPSDPQTQRFVNGITNGDCTGGTIENCEVLTGKGWCYAIWTIHSDTIQILNNSVSGGNTFADTYFAQEGIEVFNAKNVVISGNTITNIGGNGIFVFAPDEGGAFETENITIDDNAVNSVRNGVMVWHAGGGGVRDIAIQGNTLTNVLETGIYFQTRDGDGANPAFFGNIDVSDNDVFCSPGLAGTWGIRLVNLSAAGATNFLNIAVHHNAINGSAIERALQEHNFQAETFASNSYTAAVTTTLAAAPLMHHLILTGTADIDGTGNELNNTILGNAGNNTLVGGAGNDVLDGGNGKDRMFGDAGNDLLYGGAGNDSLQGGAGDDVLVGGGGNDLVYGGDGNDALHDGDGSDQLVMGAGDDFAYGGAGSDYLYGGTGNDTGYGGSGIDVFVLGDGNDTGIGEDDQDYLYGGAGNDQLYGGAGVDVLLGESGDDYLNGGLDGDYLYGGVGGDQLFGGAGHDQLLGEDGNDIIVGEDGQDYLYGGNGNDVMYGGAGSDVLIGDAGDDTFEGGSGIDYYVGGAGNDNFVIVRGNGVWVINDFVAGGVDDTISLYSTTQRDFSSVMAAATDMGTYTVFNFDGGTILWVLNVRPFQFTPGDFAFA